MSKVSNANLQDILTHIGNNRFLPQIVQHFDKSMIFSTDEVLVGQWVDGKPLYQKTITDLNLTGSWSQQYNYALVDQNPLIDNVDNIISAFGVINYQNTVNATPVSIKKDFTTNKWSYYRYVSGAINTLVIQYTKTTDSPLDYTIGDENEYSTSERLVGHWIDGSDLFQKTIVIPALPANDATVETGVPGNQIRNLKYYMDNANGYRVWESYVSGGNRVNGFYWDATGVSTKLTFQDDISNQFTGNPCVLTIQYTKSS